MQQQDITITSLVFVAMGYAINASTFSKYDVLNGTKVEGNWSTIPNVDKGYMCCIACEQDAQCTAANHNEDNKTCELTHESDGLKSTTSPGWKAYFSYDVYMCTFDYGICLWTWYNRWNITSGSTTPTGPRVDKTFGTGELFGVSSGHNILANNISKIVDSGIKINIRNDNVEILHLTNEIASGMYLYAGDGVRDGLFTFIPFGGMTGNQLTCLSFYYQSTINMRIVLNPHLTNGYEMYIMEKADTWTFISYTIPMKEVDNIQFYLWELGHFAMDDLLIKSGPCA